VLSDDEEEAPVRRAVVVPVSDEDEDTSEEEDEERRVQLAEIGNQLERRLKVRSPAPCDSVGARVAYPHPVNPEFGRPRNKGRRRGGSRARSPGDGSRREHAWSHAWSTLGH
jgi:hypothetical protein